MRTLIGAAEPEEPERTPPGTWVVTSGQSTWTSGTMPLTTTTLTGTTMQIRMDMKP